MHHEPIERVKRDVQVYYCMSVVRSAARIIGLITGNMNHVSIGNEKATPVVYAHGWGRSYHDFIQVAESLAPVTHSTLLDLPGFGDSPRPDDTWGSGEYADHCAQFLKQRGVPSVIWVGHSFGGRVGLQLAVRHPQLISGLVLVASAGIPLPKSRARQLKRRYRQFRFKMAKRRATTEEQTKQLEQQYGSADYLQSAELGLRDIFVKVIGEDQTSDARKIKTPTTLVYGNRDTETPVAIGERLSTLIEGSQLVCCPEFDHIDILNRGRHQIALSVKELINGAKA